MVEKALNHERTMKAISEDYGICYNTLYDLVHMARKHGIDAALNSKKRKRYSDEFKLKVVKDVESGMPVHAASIQYCLSAMLVKSWRLKYIEGGEEGLLQRQRRFAMEKKKKEKLDYDSLKKRNMQLEKELRRAKMELEFLKKLDALVRKRNEREEER